MSPRHTARSQRPEQAASAASSAVAFACTSLNTSKRMGRPPKRQRRSMNYRRGLELTRATVLRASVLLQVKDDGDAEVNGNGFSVQPRRLVLPKPQRINGRRPQQRIAADHVRGRDLA